MIIIPELKKIAACNAKRDQIMKKVQNKMTCDDLCLENAYLIAGCKEKNGHLYKEGTQLDNYGAVNDEYYCEQHCGYCEDDYYGNLFFKTNVPGQFVKVPFAC